MQTNTLNNAHSDAPALAQRIGLHAVNVLTVFVLWLYWTAGNFWGTPSFVHWAGEHPLAHRFIVAAVLSLFGFVLYGATRFLSRPAIERLWIFRVWTGINTWENAWVAVALALFTVWSLGRVNVARHEAFCSGFDLAIFDQAVWNTLHGKFLWSSIKGHICLLGDHMSPILLLYVPCMAVWDDVRALLWAQCAVIGFNGLLIYALCRQRWVHSPLNWVFPLAYFLYLPVRNVAHFDFHPEVLADTFIFLFFWCLHAGKKTGFFLSLIGLVLWKETFWPLVFFMGLFLCFFGKGMWGKGARISDNPSFPSIRAWGGLLVLLAPIAFWLEIHCLIPWISGKPYPYLYNYHAGGVLPMLHQALSMSSLGYLFKMFAPLGFLSFLSPQVLFLAAFGLIQNLFSVNAATRSIFFQYTTGLTPFIFIAAIYGAYGITAARSPRVKKFLGSVTETNIALWLLISSFLLAGVSEHYRYRYFEMQKTPRLAKIESYLQKIPSQTIVSTNEFFATHLSHRPYLYSPDYGGFWPFEEAPGPGQKKIVLVADGFDSGEAERTFRFLRNHGYEMTKVEEGFYEFRLSQAP